MTNSEAIEWLKYNKDELLRYADTIDVLGGAYESDLKPTIEALDMAISALEKQEGKKPLNTDEYHPYYGCPECKHIVSAVQDFCESCGQKILWE